MTESTKVFVLVSGGQDSFVCLLWALQKFPHVEAIGIKYGQRHEIELTYAKQFCERLKVKYRQYDLGDYLKNFSSALLHPQDNISGQHEQASNLPASFVPGRNGLFFTVAATHAFQQGVPSITLVSGVCQTDYSGYPDCRDEYVKAKAHELSLGFEKPVEILTPLMFLDKAATFEMAAQAGELEHLLTDTMTCYEGKTTLNSWGRGCGVCPSCLLRKKGFEKYLQQLQPQ